MNRQLIYRILAGSFIPTFSPFIMQAQVILKKLGHRGPFRRNADNGIPVTH